MSYHRFPNLGEFLQGGIVGKLRKVIGPKDFLNCEFNCGSTTKVKGTYAYKGDCRACGVVYKVTCKLRLSVYTGNTQNTLKERMEQNFQDVAQKVQQNKNLDTCAAHFAQHFDRKLTPQYCREKMKFETLSKVKSMRLMKTGSKYSCTLCIEERL